MRILINYADKNFRSSQKRNTTSGITVGDFDKAIEHSPKDIDEKFYKTNKHILTEMRGGGYWLWKPYIILKTLQRNDIKNEDYIFYADSGSYFINSINPIIDLSRKYNQDIIPFSNKYLPLQKEWTKGDTFIEMKADESKYCDTPQIGAGFILIKKSDLSIRFFRDLLFYAQHEVILTDKPSVSENHKGFIEHRHDQSIFSILCKQYNLKTFRHIYQEGNNEVELFEDKYPQIIVSTRKSDRTVIQKIKYQRSCSKGDIDFIKRLLGVPFRLVKNKIRGIK